MKKSHLFFGAMLVAGAAYYFMGDEKENTGGILGSTIPKDYNSRDVASSSEDEVTSHEVMNRAPAEAVKLGRDSKVVNLSKSPRKSMGSDFEYNEELKGLPPGVHFVSNVKAVKKDAYSEGLGAIVFQSQELVFFKTAPGAEAQESHTNVVYDKNHNSLYPVSSVIKLDSVGSSERRSIASLGHDEFYYNEDLKVLFVQSSHSKLVQTYQSLMEKGYKPILEIQRAFHKPR